MSEPTAPALSACAASELTGLPLADVREEARRMVEAWLRGLQEGGHAPASPDEIASCYRAALGRLASVGVPDKRLLGGAP